MKNTRINTRVLTQVALLAALILVMNYTPLGYLRVGPLSMSLLTIPVAIGAILMGPIPGAVLGGVFGATSFSQAIQGTSPMGAALFAISPLGSFVVCFVARVLMGLCCGALYRLAKKLFPAKTKLCTALAGLAAPMLNTVFFMGALVLIFYQTDYVQGLVQGYGVTNPLAFVAAAVGVQALVEWIGGCIVTTAVAVPLQKYLGKS